ncbi:MAG: AlpA family phage regulatory protein [Deltaproteobacteria bacterium]|nr:AlpA family phage regulatory protein [Deltaproteobacteria bacterium]
MIKHHKLRLIRFDELSTLLGGISRMTLWRLENDPTGNFPPRRRFGGNSRTAVWNEQEILEWISRRETVTAKKNS